MVREDKTMSKEEYKITITVDKRGNAWYTEVDYDKERQSLIYDKGGLPEVAIMNVIQSDEFRNEVLYHIEEGKK